MSERLLYIDNLINTSGFADVDDVAKTFEVSRKTVFRDIEYLKERLNAPVVYDKVRKGYIYKDSFSLFRFYDEKNLLFCSFLKSIIEANEFLPVDSDRILTELSKIQSDVYKELSESIIYDLPAHSLPDIEIFHTFLKSLIDKKQCEIIYSNINNVKSTRLIEPVKFVYYDGVWYLVSYCHKSGEIRTFNTVRVAGIRLTDEIFHKKYSQEMINDFLTDTFGIMKKQPGNEDIRNVSVRFYNQAIQIVKSKVFHKEQTVSYGESVHGSYMEIGFPVSDYREIAGRVLQFGADAEVVAPDNFRMYWIEMLRNMYEKFVK